MSPLDHQLVPGVATTASTEPGEPGDGRFKKWGDSAMNGWFAIRKIHENPQWMMNRIILIFLIEETSRYTVCIYCMYVYIYMTSLGKNA